MDWENDITYFVVHELSVKKKDIQTAVTKLINSYGDKIPFDMFVHRMKSVIINSGVLSSYICKNLMSINYEQLYQYFTMETQIKIKQLASATVGIYEQGNNITCKNYQEIKICDDLIAFHSFHDP